MRRFVMMFSLLASLSAMGQLQRSAKITFSEEVLSIIGIEPFGENYLGTDVRNRSLLLFNEQGVILHKYHRPGVGPGKYILLNAVTVHNNEVYLLDGKQHKILILDDKLRYLRQSFIPLEGAAYALAVTNDSIFVFCYDPDTTKVVHKFSHKMERLASFCDANNPELAPKSRRAIFQFSTNLGSLRLHGNELYVFHYTKYKIEVFSLNGQLEREYPLPGGGPEDYFNKKEGTFQIVGSPMTIDRNGYCYLGLFQRGPDPNHPNFQNSLFRFDPYSETWSRERMYSPRLFGRLDGSYFAALEDENDVLALFPFKPQFR